MIWSILTWLVILNDRTLDYVKILELGFNLFYELTHLMIAYFYLMFVCISQIIVIAGWLLLV